MRGLSPVVPYAGITRIRFMGMISARNYGTCLFVKTRSWAPLLSAAKVS